MHDKTEYKLSIDVLRKIAGQFQISGRFWFTRRILRAADSGSVYPSM